MEIQLKNIAKKKIKVTDENGKVVGDIYLNITDVGVLSRIQKYADKFQSEILRLTGATDNADFLKIAGDIDQNIRKYIDDIFNSEISDVMTQGNSMLDVVDGNFRFMDILLTLSQIYDTAITGECEKIVRDMRENDVVAEYLDKDSHEKKPDATADA